MANYDNNYEYECEIPLKLVVLDKFSCERFFYFYMSSRVVSNKTVTGGKLMNFPDNKAT